MPDSRAPPSKREHYIRVFIHTLFSTKHLKTPLVHGPILMLPVSVPRPHTNFSLCVTVLNGHRVLMGCESLLNALVTSV